MEFCYLAPLGPKPWDLPASASQAPGLQMYATTLGSKCFELVLGPHGMLILPFVTCGLK